MVSEDMAGLDSWKRGGGVLQMVSHLKGEKENTLRNSLEWHQVHSLKKLSVGTKGTTRMAETLHLLLPGTGCWRSPQGLDSEGESVMSD